MSSDPGDIHETISAVIKDRIRVSVVGIAAQVAICAELCAKTNGGDEAGYYNIALHEQHLRELLIDVTTPPATRASEQANASLLMMGFPSRTMATGDSINYCACHNRPTREGYECTRCAARVCRLPSECPGCGLTLILSTHLARSYHHLFPLRNWVDVPWSEAGRSAACYACQAPFPSPSKRDANDQGQVGLSETSRYACEVCGNHFCIDCDLFAHEVLHNCPGCQSSMVSKPPPVDGVNGGQNGNHVNGSSAMEVDS
jgi:transcription initiation factor TFIIH subunit 2